MGAFVQKRGVHHLSLFCWDDEKVDEYIDHSLDYPENYIWAPKGAEHIVSFALHACRQASVKQTTATFFDDNARQIDMLQGKNYVPITRNLLHSLLDKAPLVVKKHGMHGWSVSGHHMRPSEDAPPDSLWPSSLKHNLGRYEDDLLEYTLFPGLMYGAMFGVEFLESERLRPCFGKRWAR